jgi:hypothetical protein
MQMSVSSVNAKTNYVSTVTVCMKRLCIVCLAAELFCGCANAQKLDAPAATAPDSKSATRNNAASLLADLLSQDKNIGKILFIKHTTPDSGKLIKEISKAAGNGAGQLEALAKSDTTLNLHALDLPPGEKAVRASDSKTTEHELLHSSGGAFEFNLLLSQTQALSYGSHLAQIAAENSSSPEQTRVFHSLDVALSALYQQVVAKMRTLPPQ